MVEMAPFGRLIGDLIKTLISECHSCPVFLEQVGMKVTVEPQTIERRQLMFQGLTANKTLWTCCNAGS